MQPYRLNDPLMVASPRSDAMYPSDASYHQPDHFISPSRPLYSRRRLIRTALVVILAMLLLTVVVRLYGRRYASALPNGDLWSSTSSPQPPPSASSSSLFAPPDAAPTSSPTPFSPPPTLALSTVASYSHTSSCFTQGLAFYRGALYESCGTYGSSLVRLVNLTTGASLASLSLDRRFFAEGLTVLNDVVYLLTWQEKVILTFSLTLTPLATLTHDSEGWGLTHNGSALIISDGSSYLSYREPKTLRLLRRVQVTQSKGGGEPVPVGQLNELEYIGGYVYANVWMTTSVVVIDDSGAVVRVLDGSLQMQAAGGDNYNKVMNGVAYNNDTQKMYMTGKYGSSAHTHTRRWLSQAVSLYSLRCCLCLQELAPPVSGLRVLRGAVVAGEELSLFCER